MEPPPIHALAERIHQLGHRMLNALDDNRLLTFAALIEERELLVDRLQARIAPSEDVPSAGWRTKLSDQHEQLTAALHDYEDELARTLHQLERTDTAHREYERSRSSDSLLDENFSI